MAPEALKTQNINRGLYKHQQPDSAVVAEQSKTLVKIELQTKAQSPFETCIYMDKTKWSTAPTAYYMTSQRLRDGEKILSEKNINNLSKNQKLKAATWNLCGVINSHNID